MKGALFYVWLSYLVVLHIVFYTLQPKFKFLNEQSVTNMIFLQWCRSFKEDMLPSLKAADLGEGTCPTLLPEGLKKFGVI